MTFIDLFCGMGTFRMGMEQAGHECVYSVEWDKHKRKIYGVIFGHEPEGKDIRDVHANTIPHADCYCFGAPCQDFSIAGLRSGMDGDRSSLVREVFRLIREAQEEHRPEWLIYENVKGMLSSNKGLDYLEILFEMASLGYDIEYELLNTKDFGVPQNRERVYTIGHLGRCGRRKVFPLGGQCTTFIQPHGQASGKGQWVFPTVYTKAHRGDATYISETAVKQIGNVMPTAPRNNPNQGRVYDTEGLAPCLNKMEGGGREPMIEVRYTDDGFHLHRNDAKKSSIQGTHVTYPDGKSHCLNTSHIPMTVEPIACLTPDRAEKKQNGRRFKEPREPMFTLTAQDIHGVLVREATKKGYAEATIGDSINLAVPNSKTRRGRVGKGVANTLDTSCNQATVTSSFRIRRLTPTECFRLQAVPEYIIEKLINSGISDSQLYRAAGDACTVKVVYEVGKKLSVTKEDS